MNDIPEKRKSNFTILVFIFTLLSLILIVFLFFIKRSGTEFIRITSPYAYDEISLDNSYLFASPVRAKAGGDLIRLSGFILDSNGLGIADKKITLNSEDALVIKEIQAVTDDSGKFLFDISSEQTGQFYIDALVDTKSLPQRVRIIFY